jgi:hypothetical protein
VVWAIVAVFSGLLLLVVLFVGAILAVVFGALRSSDPYRFAIQTATHDPRVIARLGSPISTGWLMNGSIKEHNDSGEADLSIPVHGSIHKGAIHVVATKSQGEWTYQQLKLRVEDGSDQLDLLRPETAVPKEK